MRVARQPQTHRSVNVNRTDARSIVDAATAIQSPRYPWRPCRPDPPSSRACSPGRAPSPPVQPRRRLSPCRRRSVPTGAPRSCLPRPSRLDGRPVTSTPVGAPLRPRCRSPGRGGLSAGDQAARDDAPLQSSGTTRSRRPARGVPRGVPRGVRKPLPGGSNACFKGFRRQPRGARDASRYPYT